MNLVKTLNDITYLVSLLFLISFCSCKEGEQKKVDLNTKMKSNTSEFIEKRNSKISQDSTIKPRKVDLIFLHSENQTDTLIGFCNCEKNIKNNTLKIQVRTEFPSLNKLRNNNRSATEFQTGVDKQYRFITFYLKDSLVDKTKIFKASTKAHFNDKKIDSFSFDEYKININQFHFEIAQNVWGDYQIDLSKPFGFIKNEKKLNGTFRCNNWRIVEYEDLHNWTLKD